MCDAHDATIVVMSGRHTAQPVLLCSACFQQDRDVPAAVVVNGWSACSAHAPVLAKPSGSAPEGLVWR